MRYFITIACIFLLLGATNYYTASQFRGKSIKQLIHRWGTPNEYIKNPDASYLIYKTSRYQSRRTSGSPQVGVNVSGGRPVIVTPNHLNQYETHQVTLDCYTTFKAVRDVIVSVKIEGSGC